MKLLSIKKFFIYFFITILIISAFNVYASTTDGTIDADNYTALLCKDDTCTTSSQINFLPTHGTAIHITSSLITGNAWSEDMGWINFNPAGHGGVTNTSSGTLGGYAWGENAGWINFAPSHGGGVSINSSGQFYGWAWAQNFGWIKFDCAERGACVETDWRPTSGTTYVVNSFAGPKGSISPSSRTVVSGQTTTFTVNPNSGYQASITSTCGGGHLSGGVTYTTGPITSNCTVTATFSRSSGGGSGGGGGGGGGGDITDVCPNISGAQTIIPTGLVIDAVGDCIAPEQCNLLDGALKQPLDVMIIIDKSGSMAGTKLTQAKNAATNFINNLVPGSDRVGYVTYSTTASLITGLNTSFTTTKTKIQSTTTSGNTNIGGAIQVAYQEINNNGRDGVKPVIILLTDGEANVSDIGGLTANQYALNKAGVAKTDGMIIYTVGLGNDVNANLLKSVATLPSYYYFSPTGEDLSSIYLQIAAIECTAAPSKVMDMVIYDINANGSYDLGEIGLVGSEISLISKDDSQPTKTATSLSDGTFVFNNVPSGGYLVCNESPSGMYQTYPNGCYDINVIQGINITNLRFLVAGTIPSFCTLHPTDPACITPPFCTLHPTDPTCVTESFCTLHPTDPTCVTESFCTLHPTDPTCQITPPFCTLHPTDPYCQFEEYCISHPTDQSCVTHSFCVLNPNDPSCQNVVTFCTLHPTDPTCQIITPFCTLNPTDPSCVSESYCILNPNDPSCSSSSFCTLNPNDPSCGDITTFCTLNPTNEICITQSFCILNPGDPSCQDILEFCQLNPTNPSCQTAQIFCELHPNDPSCQVDVTDGNSGDNSFVDDVIDNIFGDNGLGGLLDKTEEVFIDQIRPRIFDILENPAGNISTKLVATTGAVFGTVFSFATVLFSNPLSISELFLIPVRLWNLILMAFGLRKRSRPWGTVYDSVTKQPLDPAYVVLQDLQGNEVSTCITDLDGRYGFLVPPGSYRMVANKTNYDFPSKKLAGKTQDVIYQDLYFNEIIEIKEGDVVTKNIPMDPLKFDWNEFAKRDQKRMKFFRRRDIWIARISDILFWAGFVLSTIAIMVTPSTYNTIIFTIYIILFLLRNTILKSRPYGTVKSKGTSDPLSFAILRVFSTANNEITHKVTDRTGRYYCLVPNGNYYVKMESKNADESYSLIHTSDPIAVKKGYINKKFEV